MLKERTQGSAREDGQPWAEEMFRLMVESVEDYAIFATDSDGTVVSWNVGAQHIFGYAEAEIVGENSAVLFTPEDIERAAPQRELEKAATKGRAADERWHLRKDGSRFWASGIVTPLKDEDGKLRGFVKVARDETRRQVDDEQLRLSETRSRSLIEQSPFSIQILSPDGHTLRVNRAWEQLWGVTAEQIADYNMLEDEQLVVKGVMPYILKGFAGEATAIPAIMYDPEETIPERSRHQEPQRWVRAFIYPVKDAAGRVREVVLMHEDITERRRVEEERDRLLTLEQSARAAAEEALGLQRSIEERLTLLVEASGVLLGSTALDALQPAILNLSRRLIAADAYAIWRVDPSSQSWRVVSHDGLSESYYLQSIPEEANTPTLLEQPVIAGDTTEAPILSERQAIYRAEGIKSLLVVPLRIHGVNSGTLTFYYRSPHQFSETQVRVATALANLAGSAISSTELYEEQSRMRSEAEDAERRAHYLAEASRVIASTLDYQKTLAQVAQLVVPDLADWCAVDMTGDDGSLVRLAVAHADPAKVEWASELQERYPVDMDAPQGVPNVLRTGESELYAEILDEMLVAGAIDDEHLRIMRDIGFTSAMVVPLSVQGRTLGAMTFVSAESGRRYGPSDLAFAEDIARRAAAAIDNARLYREAQAARHAAEEASRLKDEFLATVSHELRTPLTAMLGWAYLLRAGQLDEPGVRNALETIERNARSQSQLIDDLLDVSRIITGKLRLDVRQVDPASFIEAAIEALRPAAEAKSVRIQKVMDTGVSSIAGDPARLQQVVWNLLSNAIKFTPKGGRVQVRLERVNSHIEIAVSDTGFGISAKFLPHVFERFRQADQSTTREHGGLGLGLAIVRHLVELHGGTVRAESHGEGQGATFTVMLPLLTVYESGAGEVRAHPKASDGAPVADCPEKLDGLKVLVVDDEADTRELLSVVLGRCGAEVTTAGSVVEALDLIERLRPDVLVSDIGMPGEDGYELIRKVRALAPEKGGRVPAVALTAYARTEDRLRVLRSGYQMHIPKPVELTELVAIVANLSERARQS
ncbi:MAG TPA: PAS domain S-box protein [Pyrinomonadaceae bacterium]